MKKIFPYIMLIPACGFIIAFMGFTFYAMIAQSFGLYNITGESSFSLSAWTNQLNNKALWDSIKYSFKIGLFSAVVAILIAFPLTLLLTSMKKGGGLLSGIIKAPLFVPALVASFLIVNFISFNGFFNQMLMFLGLIERPLRLQNDDMGIGVIVIQVWKNIPFALLIITSAVTSIKQETVHAARDLGAGYLQRLVDLYIPLCLNALALAFVLIFIGALGDFAIYSVAGPRSLYSMATLMNLTAFNLNEWDSAAVIATMLMAIASVVGLVVTIGTKKLMQVWR